MSPCEDHADAFAPRPEGGWYAQTWEGLARMARARQAAWLPLDDHDREALARQRRLEARQNVWAGRDVRGDR